MADSEKDYIVHGPPLEYVVQYISAGKYIYDRLAKDPAFIGQIEAHTGHKYSFAEILDRSIRLALWFRDMDIRPGDVVSYVTLNHRDVIIVLYATLFVGAVLSPWDALLSPEEIACLMGRTEPKIVICSKEAAVAVETAVKELHVTPVLVVHGELSGFIPFEDTQIQSQTVIDNFHCTEVEENDLALLVCTSGTSGLPKIVQRTHKYILMATQRMEERSFDGNVFITFLPISWGPGLNGALIGPSARLQRVVAPYFDNKLAWDWIEEYKVNLVMLSTPMYLHMINSDAISNHDLSSLQAVAVSGSELSESHYKIFEERVPVGCKLIDHYGNTETFGVITRKTQASNPLSRGKFLPGISGKIVDPITGKTISPYEPGEVCLKHVISFAGYHNDPALTKSVVDSDGWFHTGDLARFDKNGDLYIIDRLKEVINVNGFKVIPIELEAILGNHPGVDCVAVVGKRISTNLEHPVAFVVKTPGSNVTEEELRNFLKARVKSDAKQLQGGVRFIRKMPIVSSGKIRRCVLRKILELETS